MNHKAQIKVIKKNALTLHKTPTPTTEIPKRNATREIASTVSGWVNEFQMRRKDTKQSFDYLFAQN